MQVMRNTVDLPAAFAPVRRLIDGSSPPSAMSLGMKLVVVSMHGWRKVLNSRMLRAPSSSTNSGRQDGDPRDVEALASDIKQSSWAMIFTAASQTA